MKTNERRLKAKSFMTKMETVLSVSGVPVVRGCKENGCFSVFCSPRHKHITDCSSVSLYRCPVSNREQTAPRGKADTVQ